MRGIYTSKRHATAPESWRSSLEAMSLEEIEELFGDDEKAQWFASIAGRLPDDRTPVGEVLTEEDQ